MIIDKDAAAHSERSTVKRSVLVNGIESSDNQRPSKIILTTIENSTTVWLDYVDESGDPVFADTWFINYGEAMTKLQLEFGSFHNEWIAAEFSKGSYK